jgi:outer membrane immunogenic protein
MRRILLAAVMFGAASCAEAADLSDLPILRGAFTDGLATRTVNWQGAYLGVQAGTGRADMNFAGVTAPEAQRLLNGTTIENVGQVSTWPLGGKDSVQGSGIGGFVGYNSQWDDVLLGVEFNYLHATFDRSQTDTMGRSFSSGQSNYFVNYQSDARMAVHDMGSLRLRAGYAIGSFLPYAFGGVAVGQADITKTARVFGDEAGSQFDIRRTEQKNNHFVYGYSGGLGVDVMLWAGLFLRAEWEYLRFTAPIDTQINTVRAGLGYKF